MKKTTSQTLGFLRKVKGGKVEAIHRWATGHQVLVFSSQDRFKKEKAKMEATCNANP